MNRSARLLQVLTLTGLALASAPLHAGYQLGASPKVVFQATGSVMDLEGVGRTVNLQESPDSLTFVVPMKTVTTDNTLRDSHMHDTYAEVAKFPDLTLTVPRATLKLPAAAGEKVSKATITGTFTAHGVSQPVVVSYSAKRAESSTKVEATFDFDVSKHGIAIPNYLGVTVEPRMKAQVSLELLGG
jgi:polyisoprenoid-binding protein YceI